MFEFIQGMIGVNGNSNKVDQMPTIPETSSLSLMEEGNRSIKPIPYSKTNNDSLVDLEEGNSPTFKPIDIPLYKPSPESLPKKKAIRRDRDLILPRPLTASPPLTYDVFKNPNHSEEEFLMEEQIKYNNPKKIPTPISNNSTNRILEDMDTYDAQRRDLGLPKHFGGKRKGKSKKAKNPVRHTRKRRGRSLRKGRKGGGFGDDFVDTFAQRQKEKKEMEMERKRARPPSLSSMENLDPQLHYHKKTMTADDFFNYKKDLELEKKREFNKKHNLNFLSPEDQRFNQLYPSDGPNAPHIKYMQTEDGVIMINPTNSQALFRDEMEYENQAMDLDLPENFGGKRRKSKKRYSHRNKKSTRKSSRTSSRTSSRKSRRKAARS